jgi:hypothetical protein
MFIGASSVEEDQVSRHAFASDQHAQLQTTTMDAGKADLNMVMYFLLKGLGRRCSRVTLAR